MVTFDIHKWFVSSNSPKFCQVVFNLKRKESLNTIHYLCNNKDVYPPSTITKLKSINHKIILFTYLFNEISLGSQAQIPSKKDKNEKEIKPNIDHVTVYLNSAQVSRTVPSIGKLLTHETVKLRRK